MKKFRDREQSSLSPTDSGSRSAADQQIAPEVFFKLIAVDTTHALNASRAPGSLTHKDARVTRPAGSWKASAA